MKNYVRPGDTMQFTAPSGGVVAGNGYLIGSLFCIAKDSGNAGDKVAFQVNGVATLPTATGTAWTEGLDLYWDNTGKLVTATASGNKLIGCAAAAKATGPTAGEVRLNGTCT